MARISLLSVLLLMMGAAVEPARAERPRPKGFGARWVRKHPFTIMGLTQRPAAVADDKYSRAGFSAMLAWKRWPGVLESAVRQRIPWHMYVPEDTPLSDKLKARVKRLFGTYPGGQGFLVWDEPERPELKQVGQIVAWLKDAYPDTLVYSKAYIMVWGGNGLRLDPGSAAKQYGGKWLDSGVYDEPPVPYSYDEYLRDFVRTIRPDVLCIDPYPFIRPPEGNSDRNLATHYFKNISAIRKAALQAGIPYWSFVQAYEHTGGGGRRYPSESDLRMQIFSSLAYGFTGILYFTYDHVFDRGLLKGVPGSPTYLYHVAQKVNREVAHLGRALRFLKSTDVRFIRGTAPDGAATKMNPAPYGLGIFHPNSRVATEVREIAIQGAGAKKNGLIGFFRGDDGGSYFMLVNLWQDEGASAADRRLTMTLRLAPAVKTLRRLSRETGGSEQIPVGNGTFEVTLPGGTGELFKIGDSDFPAPWLSATRR